MSNSIFLSLVFHNHQPVGNFDFINERSYAAAYLPMVALLEKYPNIHVGLHFSGSLLAWLAQHHPEVIERIKTLVQRGQVELLTGGYYEPIMASLHDADKLGQIQKLTETIRQWFETEPVGIWLAERVWEPYLAKPLAEAGAQYVIVDDTHFEMVGFDKDKDLFGYFVTEEQGHKLAVFPTLTRLRYSIPWGTVQDNIDWLRQQANDVQYDSSPKLVFMGEDGEKFGVWPGTHEHCWQSGYMDELFAAIDENSDWLQTVTPGVYMNTQPALGRVYLPTASYMEMGEWALPPAQEYTFHNVVQELQQDDNQYLLQFIRGGFWRNFMVKYDEINRMHKRALHISKSVHAMPAGADKDLALDLLWAAQSNDAYWHGVFGGIYLFHFRVANYANLIAAEMLALGENPPLKVEAIDINLDNCKELVVSSGASLMIFDVAHGGVLKEWDHRPAHYNLLNLMTRRDEGYHQDLLGAVADGRIAVVDSDVDYDTIADDVVRVKEAGIEQYLIADWYSRGAFIDHFLREDATLEGFYRSAYPEQGDYIIQPYEAEWDVVDGAAHIHLSRNGNVWVGEDHLPVRVSKQFTVKQAQNKIAVQYTVRNLSDRAFKVRFGVETALAYDGGADIDHCAFELDEYKLSLADIAAHESITAYRASTTLRGLQTDVKLSKLSNLWRFPLETVTLSEAGYERGYQGTVFLHWWSLELEPGEDWQVNIAMTATMQ
ncbi:alpha-amylase/4-alpha-glucanotransferase domain-containing protein [Chloroflexota bacterium]